MTGKHPRRWLIAGVLSILVILSLVTPWPTDVLARPLTTHENPQTADVIIILGSGTRRGPDPLPTQARLRVDQGVALWRNGAADAVIFSGGLSKTTGLVESDVMAKYAVTAGLPEETILRERASTSTRENAEQVLKVMNEKKYDTAIVVTSSYHTWRACRVFRRMHITITCAAATIHQPPEKFSDRFSNLQSVLREYIAIGYYIARQYI